VEFGFHIEFSFQAALSGQVLVQTHFLEWVGKDIARSPPQSKAKEEGEMRQIYCAAISQKMVGKGKSGNDPGGADCDFDASQIPAQRWQASARTSKTMDIQERCPNEVDLYF